MKKTIRLTESDLTRIVKRVISEQEEEQRYEYKFDDPIITLRGVVNSILTDISVNVSMESDKFEEYEPQSGKPIPDYLKPYVKEVEDYVNNSDFMMRLYDSIHEVIMGTKIEGRITDEILSNQ